MLWREHQTSLNLLDVSLGFTRKAHPFWEDTKLNLKEMSKGSDQGIDSDWSSPIPFGDKNLQNEKSKDVGSAL